MHEGHRDRMRERIQKEGIDGLYPHEVLEFLLYHAVPRKDTNELAHRLLDKYGSLSRVFAADVNDLAEVKDMTNNAALFLTTLPAVFKLYVSDLDGEKVKIVTRGDLIKTLQPLFLGDLKESFHVLCLDAKNNIICLKQIAKGLPAQISVEPRNVVELALKNKAVSVIVAHNHPSGELEPSHEDIELTKALAVALELVKVRLLDHMIFGGDKYFSFAEDGLVLTINKNINRFLKEGLKY